MSSSQPDGPKEKPVEVQPLPLGRGESPRISSPYSVFPHRTKKFITLLASCSAVFSTISSFIYFPAITALARELRVSTEMVNLTITSYFIVASIAPSIVGDTADQTGRRPISLLVFTLYLAANLGLAAQTQYVALQALRCLQSAAASGTVAIAYGIIVDIASPEERGSYVGLLLGVANAAPSLGPVLGGVIAEQLSWRWIFWFLSIISGIHLILLFLFLPETARKVVGNGSQSPSYLLHKALSPLLAPDRASLKPSDSDPNLVLRLPNPLTCLKALFQKGTFIAILVGSIQSMLFNTLAASLSSQMIQLYSLNYLTAGLTYLPSGLGGILAAYTTGKLLDHDYRLTARKHQPQSNLFPIERSRLRSIFPLLLLSTISTISYGWTLSTHTHISIALIVLFFTGVSQAAILTCCGTLITDLNPNRSSTVQASYNLVRCLMNAAGVAALEALIEVVGIGWCFTVFGGVGALCLPLLVVLRKKGEGWRHGREG